MQSGKSNSNNLGESLIESVSSTGLSEIAIEAAEVALDLTLNDGLLKDIPVFGWLVKGYSTYNSITDRMFLKKVALFLNGVSQASEDERQKFKASLDTEPEFRKKVGENLLLLIDKHERLEKSFILGKVMAKVIEGKCSHEDFLRIAAAIDRAIIEDLEQLQKHFDNIKGLPENIRQSLYKSHLLDIEIEGYSISNPFVSISVNYKNNELGKKLVEYGLS
jgi:hypothetical protein